MKSPPTRPPFFQDTCSGAVCALLLFALSGSAAEPPPASEPGHLLWQIGAPDQNNAEFALAPDGSANFKEDAFFVIGQSNPKNDWPYVQPGPTDSWAGSRQHTFTILFALKRGPVSGQCRLQVSLLDMHSSGPPKLSIQINGREFERALPPGGGDASIRGQLAKGRPHRFEIPFPSDLLRAGDNDIQITTLSGSWMLYDAVELRTSADAELGEVSSPTVVAKVDAVPALQEGAHPTEPVLVTIRHRGAARDAVLRLPGAIPHDVKLLNGDQTIELALAPVEKETVREVTLEEAGKTLAKRSVTLKPVRKLTVYILPHSHTDIGYTEIQTAVETKQVNNLVEGIAAARRTASYPEGARFVWNVEVLWAADLYLHRLDDQQRADFFEAVKQGQVVLNGMYLNELTGLCRPEELVQLFRSATELATQTGVPIDAAMISDVPGYTWGSVTAMAQAGIKYFSAAPNYFDRIGTIMREWENKPFYWVAPDGKSRVLVWIPFWGYAMSHIYNKMSLKLVHDFCDGLDRRGYPYDIAYVRWSGHGDNAVPDPAICDFVRDWNTKYAWPRFIISGTGQAFRALEQRYGQKLPVVRGDWTPYWEDGAGSSARETAMNRQSSDRLAQAEALFAMFNSSAFPHDAFEAAWKNVLLYSEHTWGAWCSITEPERKETREQWEIKKGYAESAERQSKELLERALSMENDPDAISSSAFDVINSLSWPRSELVVVPPALASGGERIVDDRGHRMPTQRLHSGDLVFLARDVPSLAARRYRFENSLSKSELSDSLLKSATDARASGPVLENGVVHVRVDQAGGGIVELTAKGIAGNFVDVSGGEALNDYLYLQGDDLKDLKRNGPVRISVGENGPLVASLIIESDAPGCNTLRRELRVVAGRDYVELINLVDKARLPASDYKARDGKESLNFAFPFDLPGGQMLLDIPLGVVRPEIDQIPSACKNWFTVGRWVDVSTSQRGVTWVTLDAPLIEIGGITARLLNSQTNPDVWRAKVAPTQRFYSWAMNNHWGTNYRAYQQGPTTFRFILRPHRKTDRAEASRFAAGFSQPLLAQPARTKLPATALFEVSPDRVLVSAVKPSDDGHALIIRLFGASSKASSTTLKWGDRKPKQLFLSDTSEKAGQPVSRDVSVPGYGLVTLRAEFE